MLDITSHWYRRSLSFVAILLLPLALLFRLLVAIRRWLYRRHFLKSYHCHVPVIVVGNITVGGTGKTPFVIALANFLKQHGYRPGIVSRGYKGRRHAKPYWVKSDATADEVGDEAILLARHTNCPVVIGANRVRAVRYLLQASNCNIVISDDGLQHYRLARTLEIALLDGIRRFGNRCMLPAGPLRESVERLREVDFLIVNGVTTTRAIADVATYPMMLNAGQMVSLCHEQRTLEAHAFANMKVHAVAGIGHPERFFQTLRQLGVQVIPHIFPDHHHFQQLDLHFDDELPIVMTEKDAVKCHAFANERCWYLTVTAKLDERFEQGFLAKLNIK